MKNRLQRIEQLWNHFAPYRYMFTVTNNEKMEEEFIRSMELMGIKNIIIKRYPKAKRKEDIYNEVIDHHRELVLHALLNHPNKNFIIFEDDCRIIDDNEFVYNILEKTLVQLLK